MKSILSSEYRYKRMCGLFKEPGLCHLPLPVYIIQNARIVRTYLPILSPPKFLDDRCEE